MTRPPLPAVLLGAAGLIPFVAGALMVLDLTPLTPVTGYRVLGAYGAVILAFMGGCLWGFAARAGQAGWRELGLSVVPGLWAFFAGFAPDVPLALLVGFAVLLLCDLAFVRWGLAPAWWMTLRLPLTAVVGLCLVAGTVA